MMAILQSDLTVAATLDAGVATTVVNGATAGGTAKSQVFTVQPRPDGSARTVSFQSIPTGVFTALTANLEASSDGGTTFNTYPGGSALNFQTTPWQQVAGLVSGLVYRLNITGFTGGTSVIINASAS